jgi:hypothetical protein
MNRKMINEVCLLMTGTITPDSDLKEQTITDPDIRKQQYLDAILFYIKETSIKRIVFCDNSNASEPEGLRLLAVKYNKQFEWISFAAEKKYIDKGKGFGEGKILEYALRNSRLLKRSNVIVKATGRLQIKNLNKILRVIGDKNYFNMYRLDKVYQNDVGKQYKYYVDTRFFIINKKDFQDFLLNEYKNIDGSIRNIIEVCYADKILKDKMPYNLFPVCIEYYGVAGGSRDIYNLSKWEEKYINFVLHSYRLRRRKKQILPIQYLARGCEFPHELWEKQYKDLSKKNIAIYGAGNVGTKFYKLSRNYCKVVYWVDSNYKNLKRISGKKIDSPQKLKAKKIDSIIVAVGTKETYEEIRKLIYDIAPGKEVKWCDGEVPDFWSGSRGAYSNKAT